MKTTLLFISVLATGTSFAQVDDTENLDANSVTANISDEGFFFNSQTATQGYEVPTGSGAGTIYAAGIWAGGLDVNGQLHLTAPNSSVSGWRSGPIADNNSYSNPVYQSTYGKAIWKVTRQEVNDHISQYQQGGYTPIAAIADWPGNGDVSLGVADRLAPFVDQDGDGIYEPLDGDYPEFPGDQVVYVIQNDESYLPEPNNLGVELHLMYYQFDDNGYMGETTFLNVRAFNRSTIDYMDFKLSIFADFDIGNYADDYFGSSVSNNLMYAYNGDNYDETNGATIGYENNPPCQAIMSLNHSLYSVNHFTGAPPMAAPATNAERWNFMNGLWADGSPIFYGGDGYSGGVTTTSTKFIFPGTSDPLGLATGGSIINGDWGEYNANGGAPRPPGERRGLMSVSPGDLSSGTMICSDFAFLFSESDTMSYQNVENVENIASALQLYYDNDPESPCGNFTAFTSEKELIDFNLYPNPSDGNFTIELGIAESPVIIEVMDMMGRRVYNEITQSVSTKIHLDVPGGLYQVVVQSAHNKAVKNIIIK